MNSPADQEARAAEILRLNQVLPSGAQLRDDATAAEIEAARETAADITAREKALLTGHRPKVPISEERISEIDQLNAKLPVGAKIRFDATDAGLAAAKKQAFEIQVEDEARRLATLNGESPGLTHRIKSFLPLARFRLQKKAVTADLDEQRAALERAEFLAAEKLARLESAEADRAAFARKVETGRRRIQEAREYLEKYKGEAELSRLLLVDYDQEFGSNVKAAIDDFILQRFSDESLLAMASRIEKRWTEQLATHDKKIAELRNANAS